MESEESSEGSMESEESSEEVTGFLNKARRVLSCEIRKWFHPVCGPGDQFVDVWQSECADEVPGGVEVLRSESYSGFRGSMAQTETNVRMTHRRFRCSPPTLESVPWVLSVHQKSDFTRAQFVCWQS